jgi:hypothetical protein
LRATPRKKTTGAICSITEGQHIDETHNGKGRHVQYDDVYVALASHVESGHHLP